MALHYGHGSSLAMVQPQHCHRLPNQPCLLLITLQALQQGGQLELGMRHCCAVRRVRLGEYVQAGGALLRCFVTSAASREGTRKRIRSCTQQLVMRMQMSTTSLRRTRPSVWVHDVH